MVFKFELLSSDGDNLGSFESAVPNRLPGDIVIAAGNVRYRVVAAYRAAQICEV